MNLNDLGDVKWRKSSYSDGQANCVEVAAIGHGHGSVAVRDSKSNGGLGLTFTLNAWRQFIERVIASH
jgi:Domain of unknown function (DUF397)